MKNLTKTLRYSLYALLSTFLLSSCGGFDNYGCFKTVEDEFPNYIQIEQPYGEEYEFIVIDADSSVYYVKTMNATDTEITSKQLIHKW